jgi:hypothetical protein
MPVERRSGKQQLLAISLGVGAVLIAIGIAWGMLALAGGNETATQLRLGDDVFDAGNAVRLSGQINAQGPLLFSDVSGRGQQRPIAVNHFGDDPAIRWVAFDAAAPGAEENCFLVWSSKLEVFEERSAVSGAQREQGQICRDITVPANGEGLDQYAWKVDKEGNLTIDLRPDDKISSNGGG